MHLVEILALRQVPGAGLYLSLTRRCPLSCAHCSTNSTLASEQYAGEIFRRCVGNFTPTMRPELIVLTGGEPLLRPRLVHDLAERAHAVGTKVVLASGMFFARRPTVPPAIARAIAVVEHFTVSLDIFHEQQVPRAGVFRVIHELLDQGQDASFLVVGLDEQDPYLADVIGDIRRSFNDRVPVLVGLVKAVGRATTWMKDTPQELQAPAEAEPMPCDLAAWPVVAYDGTVVACCNQHVVDGPAPPHLHLGHAARDSWTTIQERYRTSPVLRAVRMLGPEYTAQRYGAGKIACDGYCSTCYRLSDDPALAERLGPVMGRPAMAVMEEQIALLQQQRFVSRHGPPAFAPLVRLGYQGAQGRHTTSA
jgi:pyruvate-formate lyase-activating enzyme